MNLKRFQDFWKNIHYFGIPILKNINILFANFLIEYIESDIELKKI